MQVEILQAKSTLFLVSSFVFHFSPVSKKHSSWVFCPKTAPSKHLAKYGKVCFVEIISTKKNVSTLQSVYYKNVWVQISIFDKNPEIYAEKQSRASA